MAISDGPMSNNAWSDSQTPTNISTKYAIATEIRASMPIFVELSIPIEIEGFELGPITGTFNWKRLVVVNRFRRWFNR